MDIIPSFQTKILHQSKNEDEYKLYKAAHEWSLVEPIVIERREDLQSEHKWHDKFNPFVHQITNLITFCRRIPVTLLADDVGLGKTISAGLIMSELISRRRITKILIVCPKILIPQWQKELKTKFEISAQKAIGTELNNIKLPEEASAIITTYRSAELHFDQLAKIGFEMLILDEAHKLRNLYGSEQPSKVARRFRKALEDSLFKYVLMLTATPIQNRLWDIYSLVDLLAVARNNENPFGPPGMFSKKFIADNPTQARRLRPEVRNEFQDIIYAYMSRVRRGDAKLYFPERKVQLHKVIPTPEENRVLELIKEPLQQLHRRLQISVLQAFVSSPQALARQLENMAANGTFCPVVAAEVKNIANKMGTTAKLHGLCSLVEELRKENPANWRAVIFTTRRETQNTIQEYLYKQGIACGLINGDSSFRNEEVIKEFNKEMSKIHIIISTEAGAEGVNLQKANVLVNYDLPWNPMIVEQRIGRIQRLNSDHATVCIFNMVLEKTFEEYIVGRLMEKLQLASHAIGDVESLLKAADLGADKSDESFEEKIRKLVINSLAGKNIEEEIRLASESIAKAKTKLQEEQKNINDLLGQNNNANHGPRCPHLSPIKRSMDAESFILAAKNIFSEKLTDYASNFHNSEKIIIDSDKNYEPGTPIFDRLVSHLINKGLHHVTDLDENPIAKAQAVTVSWLKNFDEITLNQCEVKNTERYFTGKAFLRVRAVVAHDSYERLIEVSCSPDNREKNSIINDLTHFPEILKDIQEIHLSKEYLSLTVMKDENISEFCRFYLERLTEELKYSGEEERRKKKLTDDFTPRVEILLVGIEGKIRRELELEISYTLETDTIYKSTLSVIPSEAKILKQPSVGICELTQKHVPSDCLHQCAISKKVVLKHKLYRSDISGRMALPKYTTVCALTHKCVLTNEAEKSAVTGLTVASSILKTSPVSGKRAEPTFFAKCEFTSSEVLESELATSQVSGKRYRSDEKRVSSVSGKIGHLQEFIVCAETGRLLIETEAEKCEITGKVVIPEILEQCEITGKKALPSELEKSVVSGKKALRKFFVSSSLSGARLLESEAIRSALGKFCTPAETKICFWSGEPQHPGDLRVCELTGLPMRFNYIESDKMSRSESLVGLLNGIQRSTDRTELWGSVVRDLTAKRGKGNYEIESVELSPNAHCLAVCVKVSAWWGLKERQIGFFYLISKNTIIGRIAEGKRSNNGWVVQ